MNFYPFLEKAHYTGKSLQLFLISNLSIIFISIVFLVGWLLWYQSFFVVLQQTLSNTHLDGTVAGQLIHQVYTISASLVAFTLVLILIWRISIPFTYARLNLLPKSKTWWHIFIFDFSKLLFLGIVVASFRYAASQKLWLFTLLITAVTILLLSFIRYYETIYFSSPHEHHFKTIFRSWLHHLRDVFFLHGVDIVIWLLSFCLLGLIIASFTYLPFIISAPFLLICTYILGRILLVWKGLWSYAAYALLTNSIAS